MGFTPQQARSMSVWQYMAALEGFAEANSPDEGALSEKEKDELWDWLGG